MSAHSIPQPAARASLPWLIGMNGISVSTLYWAQSITVPAAAEFGSSVLVRLMPGASLAGYALGVALLATVARDLTSARGLFMQLLVLVTGLCLVACAPGPGVATFACLVIGLGCSLTQRLLACATSAVPKEERPQTIGWVIGGGLCGIVLARAMVPVASTLLGWRQVFCADAFLIAAIGVGATLAWARLRQWPYDDARPALPNAGLLWRREKTLRHAAVEQACVFAAFNLGWALFPRLLALDGVSSMLPMGVVAALGAIAAVIAGRACARWTPDAVARSGLVLAMIATTVLLLGGRIFHVYDPAMAVLDISTQIALVANQARAQALAASPAMRGRIAAMITTVGFAGGALGAALGNLLG